MKHANKQMFRLLAFIRECEGKKITLRESLQLAILYLDKLEVEAPKPRNRKGRRKG